MGFVKSSKPSQRQSRRQRTLETRRRERERRPLRGKLWVDFPQKEGGQGVRKREESPVERERKVRTQKEGGQGVREREESPVERERKLKGGL